MGERGIFHELSSTFLLKKGYYEKSRVSRNFSTIFCPELSENFEIFNQRNLCYWVAVRRTYVFTLQEVEKICRTLQSHVMQVWTMTFWLLAPDPDKAESLPVLSNKLPFFSTDALAQIA